MRNYPTRRQRRSNRQRDIRSIHIYLLTFYIEVDRYSSFLVNSNKKFELAIVVPTFNEQSNIAPLLKRLKSVLGAVEYEVIFVDDDSPDGTAARVRELGVANLNLHVLQRAHRRGLASACIGGGTGDQYSGFE